MLTQRVQGAWLVAVAAVAGGAAWAAVADDKVGWTVVSAAVSGTLGAFIPTLLERSVEPRHAESPPTRSDPEVDSGQPPMRRGRWNRAAEAVVTFLHGGMIVWVVVSMLALKLLLLCQYFLNFQNIGRSLLISLLFTSGAVLLPRQALKLMKSGHRQQTTRVVALVLMCSWVVLLVISLSIAANVSAPTGMAFGSTVSISNLPHGMPAELTVVTATVVMAAVVTSGISRPATTTSANEKSVPAEAWTTKFGWVSLMAFCTGVLFSSLTLFMPFSYPQVPYAIISIIATGIALAAVHTAAAVGSLVANAGVTQAGWGRVATVTGAWVFFGASFFWLLPAATSQIPTPSSFMAESPQPSLVPVAMMAGIYLVAGSLAFARAYARRSVVLTGVEPAPQL